MSALAPSPAVCTPPQKQEAERPQRGGDLPALSVQFGGMCAEAGDAGSPRSPLASGRAGRQRQQDADSAYSSPASDGNAAAGAAAPTAAQWLQASHDREEPILQANSERFCLLPVK